MINKCRIFFSLIPLSQPQYCKISILTPHPIIQCSNYSYVVTLQQDHEVLYIQAAPWRSPGSPSEYMRTDHLLPWPFCLSCLLLLPTVCTETKKYYYMKTFAVNHGMSNKLILSPMSTCSIILTYLKPFFFRKRRGNYNYLYK